jgi:hypothetical protein
LRAEFFRDGQFAVGIIVLGAGLFVGDGAGDRRSGKIESASVPGTIRTP